MSPRFSVLRSAPLVLALALSCAGPGVALAQEAHPPQAQPPQPAEPPAKLPRPQRGDRTQNLEFLFGALKAAPDSETAKAVEERIWALWYVSGSDTADLLMSRVKNAVDGKDLDLAVELLDSIVALKPDYVEAWNRRATLFLMKKNYGRALGDIRQVLAREPRHFGALVSLGTIMQEFGEEKRALQVFRSALAVHPYLEKIPDLVKGLSE